MHASQPPPKKIKLGDTDTEMAMPPTERDSSTSVSQVTTAPVIASGTQYDQDGYIVEITKKKYTIKDLSVPSNDSRWSCGLVSTMTLWTASQPNPWVIPEESLVAAIQVIWNIVFLEIKYRVLLNGSVMGIVRVPLESDHY